VPLKINNSRITQQKAIVSLIFQNKMKRSPSTADEDIHKPTISSNYDMLVLAKNTINWIISYRLAATLYLEMTYLDL
jgi:hypothetical protein